jgi:hypothetical protein
MSSRILALRSTSRFTSSPETPSSRTRICSPMPAVVMKWR